MPYQNTNVSKQLGGLESLARIGYLAKGVVYVGVGLLSAHAAIEAGRAHGSKDVLQTVIRQPFGQIILTLLVLGLAGYSTWRYIQAIKDPENKGTDGKGLANRFAYFLSGLLHTSLVVFGLTVLFGQGSQSGSDSSSEETAATLMQQPFGRWLVGLGGLAILGWALHQLYKSVTADLSDRLDLSPLNRTWRTWAVRMGRAGIGARGVVFSIVGVFFILAAVRYDPETAQGLTQSLNWLGQQPFGPWLMAISAIGLANYGGYMGLKSAYRRIA